MKKLKSVYDSFRIVRIYYSNRYRSNLNDGRPRSEDVVDDDAGLARRKVALDCLLGAVRLGTFLPADEERALDVDGDERREGQSAVRDAADEPTVVLGHVLERFRQNGPELFLGNTENRETKGR